MKTTVKHTIVPLAALVLTACVDSKYDLSDIDTTARIEVHDLVLPVQMDPVHLSSILDIHDDGIIKEIDNEYVAMQNGTFSSEAVNIRAINAAAPAGDRISGSTILTAEMNGQVPLPLVPYEFAYRHSNVDKYIKTIEKAQTDLTMTIKLGCSGGAATFTGLKLQMPKGLSGTPSTGKYDSTTGIITIANAYSATGELTVAFKVSEIDFTKSTARLDTLERTFTYVDQLALIEGSVKPSSGIGDRVDTWIDFSFSELDVKSMTGIIYYEIQDLSAERIDLNDIPEELNQDDTHLALANPQIYVKVENPLAHYGLVASTGLALEQLRNGKVTGSIALPSDFVVKAVEGEQTYCFTNSKPTYTTLITPSLNLIDFPDLGDIVYGNGLPDQMAFNFINPVMKRGHVTNLILGQNLGKVIGSYTFYAPVALDGKSQIVYSSDETGWNSDTKDMTITAIVLTVDATNEMPVGAVVKAWPLDTDGNILQGVTVEGAEIAAGTSQTLNIRVTGEIHGLDGVRYTATARPDNSGTVLSPKMSVALDNIKVKVNGYYETTF